MCTILLEVKNMQTNASLSRLIEDVVDCILYLKSAHVESMMKHMKNTQSRVVSNIKTST